VKRFLAAIRPENGAKPYEGRFETPPGEQAQVDFARFVVDFTDDPGTSRVVWLFSLVLGHSRFLFARYVLHQDLQTLLRCHIQAFETIGGVPIEIPLRPHEDRGDRRRRSRPHRLQPIAGRAGVALSLSAPRLPTLSGQNEGKGRSAVNARVYRVIAQAMRASMIAGERASTKPVATPDQPQKDGRNVTDLEQLADLLFDAIVNLASQEFEAIAGAAGRCMGALSSRRCLARSSVP
jgi:transposase InsO family protein